MLQRVFVDSNVLASRTLRDWLFLLRNETDGMFQVHATLDILVEAHRAWRRRNHKASGAEATALFERIQRNLDELVGDFDGGIDFEGSDVHDTHVHAAAVASGADLLLTDNPTDFVDTDLLPYELYRADEFFCLVDDGAPAAVRRVAMAQITYWQGIAASGVPTKRLDEALVDAGCPDFAKRVTAHLATLSGPPTRPQPRDHLPPARGHGRR